MEDIVFIFNLRDKELTESFLQHYADFDDSDPTWIENFINNNFDHPEKTFVSDLIYFAADLDLNLNYTRILKLLIIDLEGECLIVLACLHYINTTLKFKYTDRIVAALIYIRDNRIYYQNARLFASLILYRITHKTQYFDFVNELLNGDDTVNHEFLSNLLKKMYLTKRILTCLG